MGSTLLLLILLSPLGGSAAVVPERQGWTITGGLGGGRTANRHGSLFGMAGSAGVGVVLGANTVRLDYVAVGGETEIEPTAIRHSFFGLALERWFEDAFFLSAGAGWSTLTYSDRPDPRLGGSLALGGAPLWLGEHGAITLQLRFVAGAHRDVLHTTGAALIGVAWR
ncbi:MAG TPA: hypothetical protein VGG33_23820 [Polyangia bacterium]